MGRHDFGIPDESDGTVDLAAVVADDALLDAFGRHRRPTRLGPGSTSPAAPSAGGAIDAPVPGHPVEPELTDLFATWRAVIDADPAPEPPTVDSVVLALRRTGRRRSLRPMFGVAVAICALLVGSAAVGARTARPGDVLWPVTQVLWSDRADSVVAGDTTRVALGQARMALDAGLTSEARSALVVASTVLPRVAERDGHQNLKADLDNLWSTLDWVQQQHAVAASAPAPAAPSPTSEPSIESSVGTTVTSSPADSVSASSGSAATSSGPGATSSHPSAASTVTSTGPSIVPPPSSAPLPPAPPSPAPPPEGSTTASTVPTVPTASTGPTGSSAPTSPAGPTPSTPSSPAPSTDTPTVPSTPSGPTEPSTTAGSATQQVLPVVPTATVGPSTGGQAGDQTVDPAQQVQHAADPTTSGNSG